MIVTKPSFLAHFASGVLMFIATVLIIYELVYKRTKIDNMHLCYIIAILSIMYGVHGISHAQQERLYGFNPLEGRWGS